MLAARARSRRTTPAGPTSSSGTASGPSRGRRGPGRASRNERDLTGSFPELRGLERVWGRGRVLDGGTGGAGRRGRPDSASAAAHARARRGAGRRPATGRDGAGQTHLIFDLLYLGRRSLLDWDRTDGSDADTGGLDLLGPSWAAPPSFTGVPAPRGRGGAASGPGGVAAKRGTALPPGDRSGAHGEGQRFATQEVVAGAGRRGRAAGRARWGRRCWGPRLRGLRYVGKVGTGFTDQSLEDLGHRLHRLRRATSPFTGQLPRAQVAGVTWARPVLVGEVRFSEWTGEGRLRHPSWRGLRPDKQPDQVVAES